MGWGWNEGGLRDTQRMTTRKSKREKQMKRKWGNWISSIRGSKDKIWDRTGIARRATE